MGISICKSCKMPLVFELSYCLYFVISSIKTIMLSLQDPLISDMYKRKYIYMKYSP